MAVFWKFSTSTLGVWTGRSLATATNVSKLFETSSATATTTSSSYKKSGSGRFTFPVCLFCFVLFCLFCFETFPSLMDTRGGWVRGRMTHRIIVHKSFNKNSNKNQKRYPLVHIFITGGTTSAKFIQTLQHPGFSTF